jgi:hypothetical protein
LMTIRNTKSDDWTIKFINTHFANVSNKLRSVFVLCHSNTVTMRDMIKAIPAINSIMMTIRNNLYKES